MRERPELAQPIPGADTYLAAEALYAAAGASPWLSDRFARRASRAWAQSAAQAHFQNNRVTLAWTLIRLGRLDEAHGILLQNLEGDIPFDETDARRLGRQAHGCLDTLYPVEGAVHSRAAGSAVHALDWIYLDTPVAPGLFFGQSIDVTHVCVWPRDPGAS